MDDVALSQDVRKVRPNHRQVAITSFHWDHRVHGQASVSAYRVVDDVGARELGRLVAKVLVDYVAMVPAEAMDLVVANVLAVVILQIALIVAVLRYQVDPLHLVIGALVVVLVLDLVDYNLGH